MTNRRGKNGKQWQILFSVDGDCSHEVKRSLLLESYDKPKQHIKKKRHHFANKGACSQSYSFSCSHVKMWELDHEEGCTLKNWCFPTVVLDSFESSLNSTEIKPTNPKGYQPWIFVGRTDAEAPVLWPPDVKSRLIGKDPGVEKDWGQRVGWLDDVISSVDMSLSKLWEIGKDKKAWLVAVLGVAKSWTVLSDWTAIELCTALICDTFFSLLEICSMFTAKSLALNVEV